MAIEDYFQQFGSYNLGPYRVPAPDRFIMPSQSVVQPAPEVVPVPQPAALAPLPNPMLDESLYIPTQRPRQQPFDFSRFQYPEAPRYQMPGAAPTRDLGLERRFTQQRSLRAALLGALLGGGTGALAGLTGAQQGAQQAFEQDYAQRMADYQNQARLMDIENQQLAAADQRAIAMRNTQVGEAFKAYGMEGERLDAEYRAAEAARQLKVERAKAMAEGDRNRADIITRALDGAKDIMPEDQPAYFKSILTGQPPETPIRAAVKTPPPPTGTTMLNLVERLLSIGHTLTPEEYNSAATSIRESLMSSSDPVVRSFANQIPLTRPNKPLTLRGQAEDRRGREFTRKYGQTERRIDINQEANKERARHNRAMEGISRDRNAITAIHNKWTRDKKPGARLDTKSSQTIVDGFNRISKEIASMESTMLKPGYAQADILGGPIRERIALLRSQLKSDFVDKFAGQFRFSGIDSGTPAITKVQSAPEPTGGAGGKPAGKKTRTVTQMVNGYPVKITITED